MKKLILLISLFKKRNSIWNEIYVCIILSPDFMVYILFLFLNNFFVTHDQKVDENSVFEAKNVFLHNREVRDLEVPLDITRRFISVRVIIKFKRLEKSQVLRVLCDCPNGMVIWFVLFSIIFEVCEILSSNVKAIFYNM